MSAAVPDLPTWRSWADAIDRLSAPPPVPRRRPAWIESLREELGAIVEGRRRIFACPFCLVSIEGGPVELARHLRDSHALDFREARDVAEEVAR